MIETGTRRARVSALVGLALAHMARSVVAAPDTTAGPRVAPASAASTAGEEASAHFKRGLQLFDEGDYTLALVEFERAYQLAPNYRALYNIGLVDVQLGRYADAARTFEKYLEDGKDGISQARRAEVSRLLGELKLRTATVDLSVSVPGAEISLDGRPLDPARLKQSMLIDAGEHTLRATAPGFMARSRTLTLAGGDHATVRLDLTPTEMQVRPPGPVPDHPRAPASAPTTATPHGPKIFWPGIAATGALAAGAVVGGVVMLNARSELNTLQNTPDSDYARRRILADRTNTAGVVADVFAGLALVVGGVSVYLSVRPEHPQTAVLTISPREVALSASF